MIDIERYNKLKEEYGNVASLAIWKDAGEKPKSNTNDLSVFDDENICKKLNDKYVFVGLNVSSTPENEVWRNFRFLGLLMGIPNQYLQLELNLIQNNLFII